MEALERFIKLTKDLILENDLSKITLSKTWVKGNDLRNVYIRPISLKGEQVLSFTFSYKTNDQTKNYGVESGAQEINKLMSKTFKNATLISKSWKYQLLTNKKRKMSLLKTKNEDSTAASFNHDRQKKKYISGSEPYLKLLGVADEHGNIVPKMADKFRQINKYLEIVEGLITTVNLPQKINVVDMGSGKGYLTFALYDFIKNKLNKEVVMSGVELREDLVNLCNDIANECNFSGLNFYADSIQNFKQDKIDILIALHACDTATDDALFGGIAANASLIVSAPCCHKQIRQQVKGKEQKSPLLKYGIFKERQFEMVTDTLRALILEKHQYQSKIFEFVSNEHTRKNILLVGSKSSKTANIESIDLKIEAIKEEYGIDSHYLEELVS